MPGPPVVAVIVIGIFAVVGVGLLVVSVRSNAYTLVLLLAYKEIVLHSCA